MMTQDAMSVKWEKLPQAIRGPEYAHKPLCTGQEEYAIKMVMYTITLSDLQ